MATMRNPKTGRFMSKAETEAFLASQEEGKTTAKAKSAPKKKAQKGEQKVQILVNPLAVYSKKSMEGKTSNIKAGTEVLLTPVGDAIRVKKNNSSRTFYTNQELVDAAV